jgi:chemotaxis protein methyltransferase WspC
MSLKAICDLLNQHMGLDPNIIGERKIARAIELRCHKKHYKTIETYYQFLKSSAQEFNALVEHIVVPETWFFRDRTPFDFLVNHTRANWLQNSRPIRILSAPCSTGEEPYSIVIALLKAGLPKDRLIVDAIDISHTAIAKAKRGIYGKNSFRGEPWIERDHYFHPVEGKYEINATIRSRVNFRVANLLSGLTHSDTKYHAIFCRNVLIYQASNACHQILERLEQLLIPDGLLFVGMSETSKIPKDRFTAIRQPTIAAYQKSGNPKIISPVSDSSTANPLKSQDCQTVILDSKPLAYPSPLSIQSARLTTDYSPSITSLDLAQQMADLGYIDTAIQHCQDNLIQNAAHVQTYILLGTLYQARAQYNQAEQCFRKALYLDPHNYEALMQMALLKQQSGDSNGARLFRQRIQKIA